MDVCNVKAYCTVERRDGKAVGEEKVQRDFYFDRRKLDEKYGIPVWFELQTGEHGQGKGIDLVYYNQATREINIFELKYDNVGETLLRAVLEIQTYYQRVDWYKALKGLKRWGKITSDYVAKINKYVLFNSACRNIYKKNSSLTENSFVKKLMDEFQVGVEIIE